MTDVLIRGVSDDALAEVDARAAALGISRAEYLRRQIEQDARRRPRALTQQDFDRFGELSRDLHDPEVMREAWS